MKSLGTVRTLKWRQSLIMHQNKEMEIIRHVLDWTTNRDACWTYFVQSKLLDSDGGEHRNWCLLTMKHPASDSPWTFPLPYQSSIVVSRWKKAKPLYILQKLENVESTENSKTSHFCWGLNEYILVCECMFLSWGASCFFLLFQRLQLWWGIGPQGQIDRPIRRGMSIQAPSSAE